MAGLVYKSWSFTGLVQELIKLNQGPDDAFMLARLKTDLASALRIVCQWLPKLDPFTGPGGFGTYTEFGVFQDRGFWDTSILGYIQVWGRNC